MLDTIHFRIHNLSKNATIKHQLSTTGKTGQTTAEVSQSTLESIQGDTIRVNLFHDRDNIMPLVRRDSFTIPSSHYSVSYVLNEIRDFIDFNVSIPKFEWGTNIVQYIPYYDQSPEAMYGLLNSFFKKFFRYLNATPEEKDIQIVRLDLCYNQFFIDKQQALTYLESQKGLAVKYARSSANNYRNYETSIFYSTRRYSFKIYHKGTEFEKNDRKEILKRNQQNLHAMLLTENQKSDLNSKQYKIASVRKLQHEADRILRYEMTFRGSYMDYILKQVIFSKDGDVKNNYTSLFNRMTRYDSRVACDAIEYFKKNSLKFYLASEYDRPNINLNAYYKNLNVTFNLQLFKLMYDRFWNKVKDYQLNIPMTAYDVIQKINKHNETVDMKNQFLPKSKQGEPKEINRLLFAAMLSQYYDIENMKKFIPKTTFYRLKKELNNLGINMYNNNHTVPAPPVDYLEYKYIFGNKFNLTLK